MLGKFFRFTLCLCLVAALICSLGVSAFADTGYISVELKSGELNFTDNDNISGYAKESVLALSSSGIINGYEDGSFLPQANATRAEAAQLIFKVLNILK